MKHLPLKGTANTARLNTSKAVKFPGQPACRAAYVALASHPHVRVMLLQGHQYRNVCDLRRGAATSLITVDFASHSAEESYSNPRVPSGFPYSSVKAKLSELDFIFLNRFVQEILQYISVLMVLRPPPIQQQIQQSGVPALATSSGVEATQAESGAEAKATGQAGTAPAASATQEVGSVLQLDIDVEAPVISMPRTSDSQDSVQLDLGYIHVRNSLTWVGGSSVDDPKVSTWFSPVTCKAHTPTVCLIIWYSAYGCN